MGEVLGSSAFSAVYYMLIPQLFPWLAGVAGNFSRYRWKRLEFSFITSSPTSQSGHIAMGAMYDWNDTQVAPNSIQEVAALAHSFLCPVWAPSGGVLGTTRFDTTRWNKPWYSHHQPTTSLEFSDVFVPGWLAVGRHTQVNGQSVGHLVARYEIEFLDPIPQRLQPNASLDLMVRHVGEKIEKQEVPTFESAVTSLLDKLVAAQVTQKETVEQSPVAPSKFTTGGGHGPPKAESTPRR